ncbi:DUF3106 domain-containing protein [Leptothrix discophora]|uniref:DUF3106 domain-containing protein n=1 Tax=Leptothrix discophora TaxID=89 RepID=A0ABT9G0U0_LEPDI|nr:DUF3106 domain-containing protein [Leptothrix discophora]MDP4300109.1 DUF3106 domain-containing protein [Leptothrix discophora]
MTTIRPTRTPGAAHRWLLALVLGGSLSALAQAQVLGNPAWSELSAREQQTLQPLKEQWGTIDAVRKQKWRDIAERFPAMTADQQARTTSRMAEWAAMSPAQRNAARLQFEQVRQVPASERQARWDAYQSLPTEQREALLKQAEQRPAAADTARPPARIEPAATKSAQAPQPSGKPQPVGPGTVKAPVGASTRPITQGALPPRHQQPGLPKIAATPGFIDSTTLLPQRGPQGAAIEPARKAVPPAAAASRQP